MTAGWQRVRFGDIAEAVNDRVDDPSSAGVDRYVGLEHLDPDSLMIRRWGTPDEVESTKLRFRSGDLIFGKRRAYQRKLAVADFDGICSAHAMVLRAKAGAVLPEFLPFFMQSEIFMKRAQAISVGSLSPTINWRTLAAEEFVLPPLAQQCRIAAELKVIERSRASATEALLAGERFFDVLIWNVTTGKSHDGRRKPITGWVHARLPGVMSIPDGWTITRLTEVARLESGHTPSRSREDYWNGGIPWISLADIKRLGVPGISETDNEISLVGVQNSSARLLPPGTVVLSRDASVGYVSVMAREMATSQHFANFICSEFLNPTFLFYLFLGMKEFWDYSAIGSTNVKTIYMPFFQHMQIALPPRGVQDRIVDELDEVRNGLEALRLRAQAHRDLLVAIRESHLGGRP